jgi:hypothetical protein
VPFIPRGALLAPLSSTLHLDAPVIRPETVWGTSDVPCHSRVPSAENLGYCMVLRLN